MKKPLFAFMLFGLAVRTGAVMAGTPVVTLTELGKGAFQIEGRFTVHASSREAWRILSDYDRIGEFVSSVDSSKLMERTDGYALVKQINRNGIWFLRRNFEVLLKVTEIEGKRIEFEDISKNNFKSYRGAWQIEPSGGETQVRYYLRVEHQTWIPSFMVQGTIRKSVVSLLKEVAAEIEKK